MPGGPFLLREAGAHCGPIGACFDRRDGRPVQLSICRSLSMANIIPIALFLVAILFFNYLKTGRLM